jgi:hypothetical protein
MWKRLLLALVVVASVLGAGCMEGILHPAAEPPEIVPVNGATLDHIPAYTFPFEDGMETIQIPVDPEVYAGAKGADRTLRLYEDLPREEWVPIYYLAFINDTDQDPFYAELLSRLRSIRDRRGLDDDRYLELITAFVQSIPYRTDSAIIEPKFPIETYIDEEGDCDDKSLLLAALLAREGYGTALLYFEEEAHMAVGVKSIGCSYKNTTYAYVEATNVSYIGIPPAILSDGTVLRSNPQVIPVGDGQGAFSSCSQVMAIEHAIEQSLALVKALERDLASADRDLQAMKTSIDSLDSRIDALSSPGNHQQYNSLVAEYNRLVAKYNSEIGIYNGLLEESRTYAQTYNYLVTHAYDRPGSYLWVKAHMPG